MPGSTVTTLPGLERVRRLGSEHRRLVDLDPDAVTEPVTVGVAQPRRLDRNP